jgi:hypothetical protein
VAFFFDESTIWGAWVYRVLVSKNGLGEVGAGENCTAVCNPRIAPCGSESGRPPTLSVERAHPSEILAKKLFTADDRLPHFFSAE